jgi:hypothetical protein
MEERMVDSRLTPFTRNDQAAAPDIVPLLRAEDLVFRFIKKASFLAFSMRRGEMVGDATDHTTRQA